MGMFQAGVAFLAWLHPSIWGAWSHDDDGEEQEREHLGVKLGHLGDLLGGGVDLSHNHQQAAEHCAEDDGCLGCHPQNQVFKKKLAF